MSQPKIKIQLKTNISKPTPALKTHIPKPPIKWVGGKSQILDKIMSELPTQINNYHEIFLGGGSVLLAVLSYQKANHIIIKGNIYAYDANQPLIYLYKNIQSNHQQVYDEIQRLITDYNASLDGVINRKPVTLLEAQVNKENYYYWIRNQYNQLSPTDQLTPLGSAMFIFLNKTCFRGVFRMGPKGFNVPYGNYIQPEIINLNHLNEIHDLIQGVIFECCDFVQSLNQVNVGDFVYLDPPYAPENATSFVKYTTDGFNLDCHNQLFKFCQTFKQRQISFMMNNANVPLVRQAFPDAIYSVDTIVCKRAINSKNPKATAKEVVIKNY